MSTVKISFKAGHLAFGLLVLGWAYYLAGWRGVLIAFVAAFVERNL